MIKAYLISLAGFLVLDSIWLGWIMKDFNARQFADIGRVVDGQFQPIVWPAIIVYLLMGAGVTFFAYPIAQNSSWLGGFLWGAFLGLIVFGTYDFTNLAIIKGYPQTFALIDVAWGSFAFGTVTLLLKKFAA